MTVHLDTWPQYKLSHATDDIVILQFGEASVLPPMAAAHGALVAVSLGDGVVGLFESKMPFKGPDLLPLHAMSRPLAILAMLLVGGWQYVRTK